jgi:hypothetical protein
MANSNYTDSLLYIELLFKEYSHQMSNCRSKNHVNFKSLLSYLGKNKNYMDTSIDTIVHSLINKDQVSTDKLDVILNKYSLEIENRGQSKYFKVKTVTIDEELLKSLNTNYVYTVHEDYIPEPIEKIIEEEVETIEEEVVLEVSNDPIEAPVEIVVESNNNQIEEKNDRDDFEWF